MPTYPDNVQVRENVIIPHVAQAYESLGTDGTGYIGLKIQATDPALPSNGARIFCNSTGGLNISGILTAIMFPAGVAPNATAVGLNYAAVTFNGENDNIVYLSSNLAAGTSSTKINSTLPLWRLGLEDHYFDLTNRFSELNLDFLSADNSFDRRALSITVNQSTGAVAHYYEVTDWSLVGVGNPEVADPYLTVSTSAITAVLPLVVSNTTASSSSITGAIRNAGGLGCVGAAYFGNLVNIGSTLSVSAATALLTTVGIGNNGSADTALSILNTALTGAGQYGIICNPTFTSTATTQGVAIYTRIHTAAAAFTMVTGYGLWVDTPTIGAASAVTNRLAIRVEDQGTGGVALDIASQTGLGIRNLGSSIFSAPASAVALTTNLTITWEFTNDTTLSFKGRGSDGTTRTGTITLS